MTYTTLERATRSVGKRERWRRAEAVCGESPVCTSSWRAMVSGDEPMENVRFCPPPLSSQPVRHPTVATTGSVPLRLSSVTEYESQSFRR